MQPKTTTFLTVLAILVFALTGCYSAHPEDVEFFTMPSEVDVTSDSYILHPPDEIEVHCSQVPEINLVTQQIRPDGKVAFEGIGEIYATGKTPKQLADIMREKIMASYSLTGEHPVDVSIETYRSKFYYVVGQVYRSGPKLFTGRDTVLKAISAARPAHTASLREIQVIRPSADKNIKPKIFQVDYDKMRAHGDTSKNVLLEEGDVIFVPPTIQAAIGLTLEQLLRPVGQVAFTYGSLTTGTPSY